MSQNDLDVRIQTSAVERVMSLFGASSTIPHHTTSPPPKPKSVTPQQSLDFLIELRFLKKFQKEKSTKRLIRSGIPEVLRHRVCNIFSFLDMAWHCWCFTVFSGISRPVLQKTPFSF